MHSLPNKVCPTSSKEWEKLHAMYILPGFEWCSSRVAAKFPLKWMSHILNEYGQALLPSHYRYLLLQQQGPSQNRCDSGFKLVHYLHLPWQLFTPHFIPPLFKISMMTIKYFLLILRGYIGQGTYLLIVISCSFEGPIMRPVIIGGLVPETIRFWWSKGGRKEKGIF